MTIEERWYLHEDDYTGSYVVTTHEEWEHGDQVVFYTETQQPHELAWARLCSVAPELLQCVEDMVVDFEDRERYARENPDDEFCKFTCFDKLALESARDIIIRARLRKPISGRLDHDGNPKEEK